MRCLCSHLLTVTLCQLENPILRNKNPARLRLATIKGDEPHPLPERSEGSSVFLFLRPFLHYVKPFLLSAYLLTVTPIITLYEIGRAHV